MNDPSSAPAELQLMLYVCVSPGSGSVVDKLPISPGAETFSSIDWLLKAMSVGASLLIYLTAKFVFGFISTTLESPPVNAGLRNVSVRLEILSDFLCAAALPVNDKVS